MRHEWECISVGMYDSLYKCKLCDIGHIESVDNLSSTRPLIGCKGNTIMKQYMKTMSLSFEQESDGNSTSGSNHLHITVDDLGGGPYIVLETERWSLNPEEIDVFCYRLNKMIEDCQ
jgi:hypothetical protein